MDGHRERNGEQSSELGRRAQSALSAQLHLYFSRSIHTGGSRERERNRFIIGRGNGMAKWRG